MNVFSRPMARLVGTYVMLPVLRDIRNNRGLCFVLFMSFAGILAISATHSAGKFNRPTSQYSKANAKKGASIGAGAPKKKVPALDSVFVRRLVHILQICVPGVFTRESALLFVQGFVLVCRSLLSLRMAKLAGDGLREVVKKNWLGFARCLFDFFVTGATGSVINSALKYTTNLITVRFRLNLTHYVHSHYLNHRNYYKAAVLRQGNLDNADQRIVEDLHQFCGTASDLYSRTFKPAIDVCLSTYRMSQNMGYKGLFILYSYFLLSGSIVRAISPPFPKLIADQQELEGNFRRCHQRLITSAEEIAFLDGSKREHEILNENLENLSQFGLKYFNLQFRQGIVDQWLLKYGASMVGWPVLALPFLSHNTDVAETAARYRESDTLIQAASASIGELMFVYKKLQRLAGFTGRVMELLEVADKHDDSNAVHLKHGGNNIIFENVTVHTPDDRLLIKQLNLVIEPGTNVFVSGANGAGKSSMFRVLAGLWKAQEGRVTAPAKKMFYVPQNPYMVTGNLRDQVTYPLHLNSSVDSRVKLCLEYVGLARLAENNELGLDAIHHDWTDVLSGGEKQRIGFARLYFHQPTFAILDEATSAINENEEGSLYQTLKELNITVFSISHRKSLLRFHQKRLHFVADGSGAWTLEDVTHDDSPSTKEE